MTPQTRFRLLISGPLPPQEIPVPLGELTIGRQEGNQLRLNDSKVSRRHAVIECSASECQIIDLNSSNGTMCNGKKIDAKVRTQLLPGDTIKIGPFTLLIDVAGTETGKSEKPPLSEAGKIVTSSVELSGKAAGISAEPVAPIIPPPVEPPSPDQQSEPLGDIPLPPGLSAQSCRLMNYLPGIYHTDFTSRFLALFESILLPVEWNIENFDLYLDPGTTPASFLTWLANWFDITFDPSWSEAQRRQFIKDAHQIHARNGTRWALRRVLEIYTGETPEIIDSGKNQKPHTFIVKLPIKANQVKRELINRIIDMNKPAHTSYSVEFKEESS